MQIDWGEVGAVIVAMLIGAANWYNAHRVKKTGDSHAAIDKKSFARVDTAAQEMRNELDSLRRHVKNLEESRDNLNRDYGRAMETISSLQSLIAEMKADRTKDHEEIAWSRQEIARLSGLLDTKNVEIAELKREISELKKRAGTGPLKEQNAKTV